MHNIVHIQILVTDLQVAMDFYHKIFNWKVYISPDADYLAVFEIDNGSDSDFVGGGFRLAKGIPKETPILLYIYTYDISATLDKIAQNGGKIVSAKSSLPGNHGFVGMFSDPFGNVLGLFSQD